MDTPLIRRFGHWFGHWSGQAEFADGAAGTINLSLWPLFGGNLINVEGNSHDTAGTLRYNGSGLWSLDSRGRIVAATWANQLGGVMLFEEPDDQDALALAGPLPGNRRMSTLFRVSGDELFVAAAVLEGYGGISHPRSTGTLRRLGQVRLPWRNEDAADAE